MPFCIIYWLRKACILIDDVSIVGYYYCYHCNFQAGLIEEMMEDTFEGLEDDDLEEQADQEVEKILWEVTSGKENTIIAENSGRQISPSLSCIFPHNKLCGICSWAWRISYTARSKFSFCVRMWFNHVSPFFFTL